MALLILVIGSQYPKKESKNTGAPKTPRREDGYLVAVEKG